MRDRIPCPKCGNTKIWLSGNVMRKGGMVKSYRCAGPNGCGHIFTETSKLKSPEDKRQQEAEARDGKSKLLNLRKVL